MFVMEKLWKRSAQLALIASSVFLLSSSASPQGANRISGKVTDQQGGVLPGADVMATHIDTGIDSNTVTNAAGIYVFPSLPRGNYTVTIAMSGFATYRREGLILLTGQSLTIDVSLTVAGVAETVTVTGESPMIAVQDSRVGGVVENVQIENVPINTRDTQNLALLVPGARRANNFDPTKSKVPYVSLGAGSGGKAILYTIDGGDNTDDIVGGVLQQVSMDAVQEFEVVTSRMRAEYARSGSGVVRIITKSGTNDFHGSAFEFFRDKSMNAKTTQEEDAGIEKAPFRRHQFGGNIGGPIVKDKAFFFFTFERINEDVSSVLGLPANVRTLFPDDLIDAHGGFGVVAQPFRRNYLTAKGTFQFNSNNRLDVRYAYEDNSRTGDLVGTGRTHRTGIPGSASTQDVAAIQSNDLWSILSRFQTIMGTNGLNEFVFQATDFLNVIVGATQPDFASRGTPTQLYPSLILGTSTSTPQSTLQRKYQFADNFSWTLDEHSLKFGANVLRNSTAGVALEVFRGHGTYFYANDGDPADQAARFTQFSVFPFGDLPNTSIGFYGQDDWRLGNLTLNLGVRYDIEKGGLSNMPYGPSGEFLITHPNSPWFQQGTCNSGTRGTGCLDDDTNNIAPRLGFVYDVGGQGQTVVRGGWGLFYDKILGIQNLFTTWDFGGVELIIIGNPPFGPETQPSIDELLAQGAIPLSFDETPVPGTEVGQSSQFSIGLSQQLTPTLAFDADFIYAKGTKQPIESDVNEMNVPFDESSRLFSPDRGGQLLVIESRGESTYTGLQTSLRKRFSNNVQFTFNYTLSRAESWGAPDSGTPGRRGECYSCRGDDRDVGPTDNDSLHLVVASGVFVLPADFQFSALFTFETGRAITASSSQDLNGNGQFPGNDWTAGPSGEAPGRGNFRGDNTVILDLRLVKFFRFGEARSVQIMFEAFNAFNRLNIARELESTFESANFGQWNRNSTLGLEEFQMQLGVRFTF